MERSKKLELESVYANYRGRMPKLKAPPKKSSLQIPREEIEAALCRCMPRVSEEFERISSEDPSMERPKNIVLMKKEFLHGQNRISFEILKEFSSPNGGALRIQCFIGQEGDREEIAQYILLHEDEWRLTDRFVDKHFRGKGLAAILLAAAERFVKLYADRNGFPQCIIIEAGQPSVLVTYFNKGYVPQTPHDAKMLEEILAGDPRLCLDYAVNISGPYARKPRLTGLDLYCFDRTEEERTIDNSYRVTLEKRFEPRETAVTKKCLEVHRAVVEI